MIKTRRTTLLFQLFGITLFTLAVGFALLGTFFGASGGGFFSIGLIAIIGMAGIITFFTYQFILFPLKMLSYRIGEIVEGDIDGRCDETAGNEVGAIASGFNRFAERICALVPQSFSAVQDVSSTASKIMVGSREIMEGAAISVDTIELTSSYIEAMNANIQNVATTASTLAALSRESTEAIHQMGSAVENIDKNTTFLVASVDENATEILSMSSDIRKIDDSVGQLLTETESTSASMIEMDQSLQGTQMNILEMAELAKEVNTNADFVRKKVELTQNSIRGIKDFSREIYEDVRDLEKQTGNIGRFLDVIDDMADQTNLLALNAEIIAAQEGEHGRSFSVVANEIKELSERTASSTQEIHEIIRALQSEARRSVEAIEKGNKQIDDCMQMSKSSQEALERIYDSISRATQRTTMVVNTIEEQSKVVRMVGTSMRGMDNMVRDVAKATSDQNRKSEKIIESAYRMKSITESLEGAMVPHSKGMQKVRAAADGVWRMARDIAKETFNQKGQSEEIVRAIGQMKAVTRDTVETISMMGSSVEGLIEQAKVLEKEMSLSKLNH